MERTPMLLDRKDQHNANGNLSKKYSTDSMQSPSKSKHNCFTDLKKKNSRLHMEKQKNAG